MDSYCYECGNVESHPFHRAGGDHRYGAIASVSMREYQVAALRTVGVSEEDVRFDRVIRALGLAGESGEVADYIKKVYGHKHPLDTQKLSEELGDVLWYVATLADAFELRLEDIAIQNIEKLKTRYPEGLSSELSIRRGE